MNSEEYKKAADFWKQKEIKEMPIEELKTEVEDYLGNSSVCALATGYDNFVRCTPLEYSFHNGKFWIFTEGGEKFIGLENNNSVSLAVFDKSPKFNELKSVQVMGKAKIIELMSEEYISHAEYKKIPLTALQKPAAEGHPMYLICIEPIRMDILFSDFKKQGFDSRQSLDYTK